MKCIYTPLSSITNDPRAVPISVKHRLIETDGSTDQHVLWEVFRDIPWNFFVASRREQVPPTSVVESRKGRWKEVSLPQ